ncbi:MAG TPA: ATP-dependent DNA helicase [Eubacteriales bacterium]|nr:ATP-dependent DNA helicase [Eubacteriales bacterium]
MEKRRIAVRAMVETVLLSGSISPSASSQRMLDGIRGHQALQAVPAEGAQNEISVSGTVCSENIELTVYGRIDRLYGSERIEEIKTTYAQSEQLCGGNPQHWAQAKCYAYLFCRNNGVGQIEVSLTYFHLQTGEITSFSEHMTADALAAFFEQVSGRYLQLLETEWKHVRALREDISAMPFPYESYREGQHEFAAQVYYAIREKSAFMAQAPTGTGKTMAVLFPALKALAEGYVSRIFYLTARTTQQQAALAAARLLKAPHLRTIVISAKEKMCVHEHPVCREGDCPRAEGYYDRLGDALDALSQTDGLFTPEVIQAYAARFRLCPFELSLDLSTSCDLIICDYNYAFDPRVKLQRFFLFGKESYAFLIDEAHNLPDRARGMYSAALSLKPIAETRRSIPKQARKQPLYKSLKALEKAVAACFAELQPPVSRCDAPHSLSGEVEAALDHLSEESTTADPALARELAFSLSAFRYILEQYDENYLTLYEGGKTARRITLFCADPSEKLAAACKKIRSTILFSATLTPYAFYKNLSGLSAQTPVLSLPSPFPPEHLAVFHLPADLRYNAREATLPAVADAVRAFVSARTHGNYLVFTPSHAYLSKLAPLLSERLPDVTLIEQSPRMDDAARAKFLSQFQPDPTGVTVGLAVLGGVFSEGIDLPAERLCGAVVIGVGLPQLCLERDVLRDAYEEKYAQGYSYAYQYPGLCKVLQASGRIVRNSTDRGALLLVDRRYGCAEYRDLLPAQWDVRRVRSLSQMADALQTFWSE